MDTRSNLHKFYILCTASVVCTICFLLLSTQAHAQSIFDVDFTIEVRPERPNVGEEVLLQLDTETLDAATVRITWKINGEIVKQEYSADKMSYIAGDVGSVARVSVIVEDGAGHAVTVEKMIRVGAVAMVWEGVTYTPPFYKGRALRSRGADVVVKTVPLLKRDSGVLYDKNELVYEWYIDGSRSVVHKGKGLHTILLQNEKPYADLKVFVEIMDSNGESVGGGEVVIPSTVPELLLYEDSPYVGVHYDRAIGDTIAVFDGDVRAVAEPYYMSASSRIDPILQYTWTVDGTEYDHPGTLSFGPQENEQSGEYYSGLARLRLLIENETYWLQNARIDKEIRFGTRDAWRDINPQTTAL
jgi:hypothetical protein